MECNLTIGCEGHLQLRPEQDDSIKYSLECDVCKEVKIVQRTKEELIEFYIRRVIRLKGGNSIQDIYNMEALELLGSLKESGMDLDLKYLDEAQALSDRCVARWGGKDQ